ncbi:MAG: DMT family transporter [Leptospirales bacterium]|nr:DMT family transporter [Leptospirales bacterium]
MKKQIIADILLLIVVIFWGYSFVAIKDALSYISPFNFLAYRFIISFIILIVIFRKRLAKLNKETIIHGVIIGTFLFLAYAFQTIGLKYTTASNGGFITGFSVVLVPVFSVLFIKSKPSTESVIGVSFASIGLYLLTYNEGYEINKGDILILFCAIAVAFHILTVGLYTVKNDSILLTVVQIGTVTFFSLFSAIIFETPALPKGPGVWEAILITSIFATVGAYLVQNIAQRFTSPTHTALIFSGEPVFAGIFGFFILDERLSDWAIIGCFLILFGMIISELKIFKVAKNRV